MTDANKAFLAALFIIEHGLGPKFKRFLAAEQKNLKSPAKGRR